MKKRRGRSESKRLPRKAKPRRSIRAEHDDLVQSHEALRRQVADLRRQVDAILQADDENVLELRERLAEFVGPYGVSERVKQIEITMNNGTLERRAIDAMRRAIGANEITFTKRADA